MTQKIRYLPEWGALATFVPNKKEPIYNWFHYKEGFSKKLVFNLIDKFGVTEESTVLDPFCGVGTTLLACKQIGVNAIGFDVLPVALLASSVKAVDYDLEALKNEAKKLLKEKFVKQDASLLSKSSSLMRRAFSRYALEDIIFFREKINKIDNDDLIDFFLLALVNSAINVSYAWKDGSVLKFRKRDVAPLRAMLRRTIYRMIKDLKYSNVKTCDILVKEGDARHLPLNAECIDAIITSPPYPNQIDYTKVYEIENCILSIQSLPPIRSFIDDTKYMDDMKMVMKELFRVCRPGANVAIVVGNAPDCEADIELARLAESLGFKAKNIYALNKRYELKNRTQKGNTLRESLILLEKE